MERFIVKYELSSDLKKLLSFEKRPLGIFPGEKKSEPEIMKELDRLSAGMETAYTTKRSKFRRYLKSGNSVTVFDVLGNTSNKDPENVEIKNIYPIFGKECSVCREQTYCSHCMSNSAKNEPDPLWIVVMRPVGAVPLKKKALKMKKLWTEDGCA